MRYSLAAALTVCQPLFAQPFDPGCELPFASIAEERNINTQCDIDGDGSATTRLQNRAKNNYCATGTPALVTFFSFRQLQRAVEAEDALGRNYGVPSDRDLLQDLHATTEGATIGEGSVVRLSVFISDAHYSNVSSGERVNCNLTGRNNNDMHIELVQIRGKTDECKSVTAEIPPHFRPGIWAERPLEEFLNPAEDVLEEEHAEEEEDSR